MSRWGLVTLGVVFALGAGSVFLARAFGASGSRPAALVTVTAHWLAAWAVWNFAGALAMYVGLLTVYEPALFAAVALFGGIVHYRTLASGARERARAIFVGAQLAWLVIVLVRNGLV